MTLLQSIKNVVGRKQKLVISRDSFGEELSVVKVIFENEEGIQVGKFKININDTTEESLAEFIENESNVMELIN